MMRSIPLFALLIVLMVVAPAAARPAPQTDRPVITPENAADVTTLTTLGQMDFNEIALSPDNVWYAVATDDALHIYNSNTFSENYRVDIPGITGLTWGRQHIAVAVDYRVLILDPRTGEERDRLRFPEDVRRMAFSPDGRRLAVADSRDEIAIYDTAIYEELFELPVRGTTYALAWSPDSTMLAYSDGTLHLLDSADFSAISQIEILAEDVRHIAFLQDNTQIAVASGTSSVITVHDVQTGAEINTLLDYNEPHDVYNLASSPDMRYLAADTGIRLRVWDMQTGNELAPLDAQVSTHLFWYADNITLGAGNVYESALQVFNVLTGEPPVQFIAHARFNPVWHADYLLLYNDQAVRVLDPDHYEILNELPVEGYEFTLGFAHSQPHMVYQRQSDRTLVVQNFLTGDILHTRELDTEMLVAQAKWSPDDTWITFHTTFNEVGFWQPTADTFQLVQSDHDPLIYGMRWSADGHYVATHSGSEAGTPDTAIRIWDAKAGELRHTLEGHTTQIYEMQWSHTDTRLASGDGTGLVRIWDGATGELLNEWQASDRIPNRLRWSPDDSRLTYAGELSVLHATIEGESVQVTEIPNPGERAPLNMSGEWSPAGGVLLTADANGILLLDAADGSVLNTFPVTLRGPRFAWSPDGTRFFYRDADSRIHIMGVE